MDNDTISLDSAASTFSERKAGNHYSPDAAQKIVKALSELPTMKKQNKFANNLLLSDWNVFNGTSLFF